MADESKVGLRERKKLELRKALSDAALDLMFELGLENVVREHIAERAGVSLRTFSNYFATKYDALAYRVGFRLRRSAELLRGRPADEPLWAAICEAILEPMVQDGAPYGQPTRERLNEVQKLNQAPEMQAALARTATDDLASAVAERTGTDPASDLYPRLVAQIALSTLTVVTNHYPMIEPGTTLPSALRRVFAELGDGLPAPTSASPRPHLIGLLS
ncbi:TetR/AcrR family transcriptional regulator [Paramicrobacterium agarici]|uniref:TetR family transcriptional regulator n=1 Tax=Paramicrobacterium agarici TaxID=630514 RepID=A0A2A9DTM2_9MICO|nr:TetR family transcriptional regulator [Microbacterium agarici]PFG29259.1 TetR family transcriptional regulator [Microbacterium agarici]